MTNMILRNNYAVLINKDNPYLKTITMQKGYSEEDLEHVLNVAYNQETNELLVTDQNKEMFFQASEKSIEDFDAYFEVLLETLLQDLNIGKKVVFLDTEDKEPTPYYENTVN